MSTPRNCLLCKSMICGCVWHRTQKSVKSRFGICETCTTGISDRAGELREASRTGDEATTHKIRGADMGKFRRIQAYLESIN